MHGTLLRCPRCFGSNSDGQRFCQFCGGPLSNATHVQANQGGAAAHAKLVVIAQDGTPGRNYPLFGEQTDIGRESGAIVLANDPYVSPLHGRIIYRSGKYSVVDLNSLNGIYVRLGASRGLEDGDLVLIGLEVLRFEVVSESEQRLSPAEEDGTQVFGSPAAPRLAKLCQRTVEGASRDIFVLSRTETVIGREAGDIVFTSDPFMSRRHAAITCDLRAKTFSLRDLGSSNGTYLAIRGQRDLLNGDHLRIGQHLFRLEVGMAPAAGGGRA
jgi:pSer/pThr/pTyr-binding forkhead associated (FHA) protein